MFEIFAFSFRVGILSAKAITFRIFFFMHAVNSLGKKKQLFTAKSLLVAFGQKRRQAYITLTHPFSIPKQTSFIIF